MHFIGYKDKEITSYIYMRIIHKYIYDIIFEKNMNLYDEYICIVRNDYTNIIKTLYVIQDIVVIRQMIHKLISVIANFGDCNDEIIYYCRLVLNIDKSITEYSYYSSYIQMIIHYDKRRMGL